MPRTKYHYRVLTTVDLAAFSDEGRDVKSWLTKHLDRLIPLWADANAQQTKRFFGYLLPKGLRLPLRKVKPKVIESITAQELVASAKLRSKALAPFKPTPEGQKFIDLATEMATQQALPVATQTSKAADLLRKFLG